MKTVQRFTTFEELKQSESQTSEDITSSLKKHRDFEKVMMDVRSVKVLQDKLMKPE